MKDEGLKDVDELQSYAIHRMEVFLNKHGRKLLGWDEIMEGGLAPNATVMSWRGEEGGLKAVRSGHRAVMTPAEFFYLDYYQDAPISQSPRPSADTYRWRRYIPMTPSRPISPPKRRHWSMAYRPTNGPNTSPRTSNMNT